MKPPPCRYSRSTVENHITLSILLYNEKKEVSIENRRFLGENRRSSGQQGRIDRAKLSGRSPARSALSSTSRRVVLALGRELAEIGAVVVDREDLRPPFMFEVKTMCRPSGDQAGRFVPGVALGQLRDLLRSGGSGRRGRRYCRRGRHRRSGRRRATRPANRGGSSRRS